MTDAVIHLTCSGALTLRLSNDGTHWPRLKVIYSGGFYYLLLQVHIAFISEALTGTSFFFFLPAHHSDALNSLSLPFLKISLTLGQIGPTGFRAENDMITSVGEN